MYYTCVSGCCTATACLCSGVTYEGAPSDPEGGNTEPSGEVEGFKRILLVGGGDKIEGWTTVDELMGAIGVRLIPLSDCKGR